MTKKPGICVGGLGWRYGPGASAKQFSGAGRMIGR